MSVPIFISMKFDSYQEADEFITKWALEQSFLGQGFLVKKGSLDKSKQSKEPIGRNLYCKFAKCPWKVNLRKHLIGSEEKWEVTSYVLVHNHELSFTLESDAKKKSSASVLYNEMVRDPTVHPTFLPTEQIPVLPVDPVNPFNPFLYPAMSNLNYQQQQAQQFSLEDSLLSQTGMGNEDDKDSKPFDFTI